MSICLGLDVVPDKILGNQSLLITRYHVYVSGVKGTLPQRPAFIRLLWVTREIENNIAKKTRELQKFYKKWDILEITKQDLQDQRFKILEVRYILLSPQRKPIPFDQTN